MNIRPSAVICMAAIGLAGCASLGTSSTPGAGGCTTRACIATDIGQSLVGAVAKDESVMTRAACKPSTVKRNAGDTYTARCTVTYSDGAVVQGWGNLLVSQQKVTFEPDISGG